MIIDYMEATSMLLPSFYFIFYTGENPETERDRTIFSEPKFPHASSTSLGYKSDEEFDLFGVSSIESFGSVFYELSHESRFLAYFTSILDGKFSLFCTIDEKLIERILLIPILIFVRVTHMGV